MKISTEKPGDMTSIHLGSVEIPSAVGETKTEAKAKKSETTKFDQWLGKDSHWIHPWRLTWNTIMEVWKIIFLSKWVICRFHVNLPGCKLCGWIKIDGKDGSKFLLLLLLLL